MNIAKLAVAALALSAVPALAAPGDVAVGATVYGPEGQAVGKIVSVENGTAVLDTGKHQVPLGIDMYGKGETGPTITVTKVQLETMVDQQMAAANAKRDAALIPGAAVQTADGAALGTIAEVDGDQIVIDRTGEDAGQVNLLREYFTATDAGLTARLTMAQIEEALAAQGTTEPAADAS